MYVDVHCHIQQEQFSDYNTPLDAAQANDVKRIIVNGTDHEDNMRIAAWEHPVLRKAFGLHPCMQHKDPQKALSWIKEHKEQCVAIGEIGLDKYWKPETLPQQQEIFEQCLKLSKELRLPVIVHSRKAEQEVLDSIKLHMAPVILHAFTGNKSKIKLGIEQKCYFSIPGVVCRSEQFQLLVQMVPLHLLLTETDSPYMAKQRDESSVPGDVIDSVKKIAQIKGITVEECRQHIFMNYQRVFKQ